MKTILKVRNFGPIGESGDAENGCFTIDVSSLCVLVGPQASGKSTVAKLLSIFFWLEKTFVRGFQATDFTTKVFQELCRQQEINEYFRAGTYISYDGEVCHFVYDQSEGIFMGRVKDGEENYALPKIQYVSSARNLLTILYRISFNTLRDADGNVLEMASNIPFMVKDLNAEYLKALDALAKDGFKLPIDGAEVCYENRSVSIRTSDSQVPMSSASSGIQAITPMLIVSRYLSGSVKDGLATKLQNLSSSARKQIEASLPGKLIGKFRLLNSGVEALLSESDLESLNAILMKYVPSCFINIVEEPEQNLFPATQAEVLYELLECLNATPGNRLIISTHSPYVLTALNNALLAREKLDETGKTIPEFPIDRTVPFSEVSAYMFENGTVSSITDDDVKLIGADKIDSCSSQINDAFDRLMEL